MKLKALCKDEPIYHFLLALLFFLIVAILQSVGSLFVESTIDFWYLQLKKPSWTPSPAIFGPVWTLLYVLLAFVGYIFWTRPKNNIRKKALLFWVLQLFCNGMWTYLFFGRKSPLLGLIDLILILVLTIYMMIYAKRLNKIAYYASYPYLIWIIYATALNQAIYLQN